ncbi:TPA: hypothetical protein VDU83_006745 [Pseudomonas aeruginosa]|nr:hypothetical protein [Pseudomonas aeruginosa]
MSEESPIYYRRESAPPPSVDGILAAPDTSFWLKDALRAALSRDPVDAAKDAELLATVLNSRADAILAARRGLADVQDGRTADADQAIAGLQAARSNKEG